jgi:AcrR family transcriptional regulator
MPMPRRDAGRPRGPTIEAAIFAATLEALAADGIEGLSIPRVAAAAAVNKTTVYRRWPTREALVAAALGAALRETAGSLTAAGDLRGDLRQLIEAVAARVSSPQGRALAHAVLSAHGSPELAAAAADPALRAQQGVVDLVRRAAARGEWDPEVHAPDAIFAMVTGGVMHRLWFERLPLTPAWIDVVVDVLAVGLAPRPRRA